MKYAKIVPILLGGLVLIGAGCGQDLQPKAVNNEKGSAVSADDVVVTYRGKVIDAHTKKPIPYAGIYAARVGGNVPTTDENGDFVWRIERKNLLDKDTKIFLLSAGKRWYSLPEPIAVPIEEADRPITFELQPEPSPRNAPWVYAEQTFTDSPDGDIYVAGRILDAKTGEPLTDMTVVVSGGGGYAQNGRPDAEGRFTIKFPLASAERLYLLRSNPKYSQDAFDEFDMHYQVFLARGRTTNIEFRINQNEKIPDWRKGP